jgi:gamma-glutamyl hercynylcysteine S-oxide synthase
MATPVSSAVAPPVDRAAMLDWFERNRRRSTELFDLLDPAVYYTRPIALRNPIVFYEGHLPAFNVIVLINRGLGRPGIDDRLERLFARGIDPDDEQSAQPRGNPASWPTRAETQAYARQADDLVRRALADATLSIPGHPVLDRAEGVYTALEHEAMHQETLLYMWHRLAPSSKRPASRAATVLDTGSAPPTPRRVRVPAGRATLGAARGAIAFGWDNEYEQRVVDVPAFDVDVYNVTNADYLAFIDAGGYDDPSLWTPDAWQWRAEHAVSHPLFWERAGGAWLWRAQFARVPLPLVWPVYVSHAEASAYARWAGGELPTEAQYHRAAFGAPDGSERRYPWGDAEPDATRGHFDFAGYDPVPVGSRPAGASAWGVEDLVGNGWEWTQTIFGPHPGFRAAPAYPEYSAEFFDGHHYVMKGASPVTARELIRPTFRNWFRATYPYVYASFRCVRPAETGA